MSSKKWVITFLTVALAFLLAFGGMEFYLDPLLQYGKDRGPLTYREYTEMYSNPGIAKNYDYNAVLLGSSMVENTDVSEMDKLFDCTTIKVPYSGGSSYNHKKILDICYRSGHKVDKVFWALDEYALTTEKNTPRYPLPEYLYDENKWNDVSYLLNLNIFYFYTYKDIFETRDGRHRVMMKDGSWIADESIYCAKNALAAVTYPLTRGDTLGEKYYETNLNDNLKYNILPLVENHPETEFHFYMVPYSVLYWRLQKKKGTLEAEIYDAAAAVGELLKHDNVKVHFFQDEKEIITDLNLYKDYSHFAPAVNSWMSKEMKKESHALTRDTYEKRINDFYNYLDSFDDDAFYLEQKEKLQAETGKDSFE